MAGMNKMRALNRLPYDFEDGLLIAGVDVTSLNQFSTANGAGLIGFTPVGNLGSTTVQAAIAELDVEKVDNAALAELESEKVGFARLDDTDGSSLVGYDTGTVQDALDAVTGPTGAASVGYTPAGVGAVPTTVQSKLREHDASLANVEGNLNFNTLPTAVTPVDDTDLLLLRQGAGNTKLTVATVRAEFAVDAVSAASAAQASRVAAEAARDAAQLSAGVYATTTAGLAATTNGQYFNVPASSANDSLILYLNSSGTAVEVKRYPSTAVVDSLAETTSSNNGTRSLVAWTDSAGEVVMSLSADGKLRVAGNAGPLTDAPQIVENANTVLVGFASADDEVVAGFDSDGDLLMRGHGNLMNRIASNDFITGLEYESWGDVSKKLFYFDKAKSALGKRININRIVIGWNEDADTDYVRFPYALPLSDTTGLLFFGQRRAPQNTGEDGNRLCVRDYTINYANKTITTSATRVIDQPSGYVNRQGVAAGAAAVKLPNGNIVMTYMRLLPDTMVWSDPSYENHIYRTISTDNGATWSTPTSVMGPAQTYNALTGGTGGMPGSLPSRLGPNSGTGNWLIRIPSGPYAGRLVFSMYFENNYFGCAYSDDNGATWTRGTLTNAAGGNTYNETAIEFCSSDGSIVALRRCENILGVGRFVSTDGGATFSFSGHVSSAGFSNSSISLISASRSAATGFEKLIAANTTDSVNYRRQFHQLRLSYDKGATFVGKASLFPDNMNVGYGSLARMGNGYYLLSYETFNGTGAINTQNNIGVYVFNEAELFYRAALV